MHDGHDRKNPVAGSYRELRVRPMHRHAFCDATRIDKQRFIDRLSRVRRIEPDERDVPRHDVKPASQFMNWHCKDKMAYVLTALTITLT